MVSYNGYNYRTLHGAPKDGSQAYTSEGQVWGPMPEGFEVSPDSATDSSDIAQYVIAPYKWDVWRLCTASKCYAGRHYGGSAHKKNDGETSLSFSFNNLASPAKTNGGNLEIV